MVLVARMELHRGKWRGIAGVKELHSGNLGYSLLLDVASTVSPKLQGVYPYEFYFDLLALNYAPVVLLPSATVEGDFKLDLTLIHYEREFSVSWESMYLVNKGFGYVATSHYVVILGQRNIAHLLYETRITNENALLGQHNYTTQLPMFTTALSTVSSLL